MRGNIIFVAILLGIALFVASGLFRPGDGGEAPELVAPVATEAPSK